MELLLLSLKPYEWLDRREKVDGLNDAASYSMSRMLDVPDLLGRLAGLPALDRFARLRLINGSSLSLLSAFALASADSASIGVLGAAPSEIFPAVAVLKA